MSGESPQDLLRKYAPAVIYVVVRDADGREGIGSGFHVGEGVFVTARHVVDGKEILEVKSSEMIRVPLKEEFPEYPQDAIDEITSIAGSPPSWPQFQGSLRIIRGPFFHSNKSFDVAVFKVEQVHPQMPFVPLGSHLDDWIMRAEWRLSSAIILGYPPIPFTLQPELVAATAEINTVVWPRHAAKAHFILSAIARGGFSGGLALHQFNFALGLITESLVYNNLPAELGFLAVLSVEPIFECLAEHHLLPVCQKEHWDGLWNTETADFIDPTGLLVAWVSVYDDGRLCYLDVSANDPIVFGLGVAAALGSLSNVSIREEQRRDGWLRIHVECAPEKGGQVSFLAAKVTEAAIKKTGLKAVRSLPKERPYKH